MLSQLNDPLWSIPVKTTLIVVVAAVLCALLHKRYSAAVRHRIWLVAMAAVALAPLSILGLPSIAVPIYVSSSQSIDSTPRQIDDRILGVRHHTQISRVPRDDSRPPQGLLHECDSIRRAPCERPFCPVDTVAETTWRGLFK